MKNEKSITFYRIYFNLKGSMRTNPVRIFFVLSTAHPINPGESFFDSTEN